MYKVLHHLHFLKINSCRVNCDDVVKLLHFLYSLLGVDFAGICCQILHALYGTSVYLVD